MNFVLALLILAQDDTQKRLDELEKRVKELEQKQQERPKEDPKKVQSVFDEGFWLIGHDDKLRIGGSAQLDGRFFLDEVDGDSNFLVRHARLWATGVLEHHWGYMVMGRWDRQAAALHFAWIESQHVPWFRVRMGLFKEPFSLEGLHSDLHWEFNERSMGVANLLQLEDIGLMAFGRCWEDRVEYGLGVFNGRGRAAENNPEKEYVARIVLSPVAGLYLGASGSSAGQDEVLTGTGFATGAGTRLWNWAAASEVHDDRERFGFDVEWLSGPFAVKAEYVNADWGDVRLGAAREEFDAAGWFVQAAYVLTGEAKRRDRSPLPAEELDPLKGTWGAWEVSARYEEFSLEDDVLAAGLATGTDKAKGYTFGVIAHVNKHMALKVNWQVLDFDDDIVLGSHRNDDESVLFVRLQGEF